MCPVWFSVEFSSIGARVNTLSAFSSVVWVFSVFSVEDVSYWTGLFFNSCEMKSILFILMVWLLAKYFMGRL